METNTYEIPGLPVVLRRKRAGQVWTARIKRPGGGSDFGRVERTTGCRDLLDAIGAAHRIYSAALASPTRAAAHPKIPTFEEVATEFLEREKLKADSGRIKLARYERQRVALVRHFIPGLGSRLISDLGEDELDAFLTLRKANLHQADPAAIVYERAGKTVSYRRTPPPASDESLRRERTIFGAVMKFATQRKYISARPLYPEIEPTTGKNRRPAFTPETMILIQETSIDRMLATRHPLHRRQRLMCHLRMMWIYLSGLRPQEVALLKNKDVEPTTDEDEKLTFRIDLTNAERLKNQKHRREVVALPEIIPFIEAARFPACTFGHNDFFFADTRRRPLGPSNRIFRELLAAAAKKQKLWEGQIPAESSPYYSLRHTFITERLYEGWDIGKVARHCGTSAEMVDRYYSHVKSVVERTSKRPTGPYIVPLPFAEITEGRRGWPPIIDFEPEFQFPEPPEDEMTPDEEQRRTEQMAEDVG